MKFGRKIGKVALILIPVLLLTTSVVYAAPLTWTESSQMSTYITVFGDLMQEGGGGRIWMMYTQTSAGLFFISYRTSTDGGATWGAQVDLTDHSGTAWFFGKGSIIEAANGSIYLIYIDSNRDINLRRLRNFATNNWTSPTVIFDGSSTNGTMAPDATVLKDGTIMVVFHEKVNATRTGLRVGEDIWGIKSTDNGQTWSAPFLVFSDAPGYDLSDQYPTIAQTCDGTIHVVFSGGGVWTQTWVTSTDGSTWTVQGQIAASHSTLLNNRVRKTVDGGLALVYEVKRGGDTEKNVYISFYDEGSWTAEERVTSKVSGDTAAQRPYVVQIGGTANDRKMLVGYRWDPTGARGSYYSISTETVTVRAYPVGVEINEIFGEPSSTPEELYEWVEIINTGTSAVDVSGWRLTDGENNWTVPALTPSLNQWDTFVFDVATHNDSVIVTEASGGALAYLGTDEGRIKLYDSCDSLMDEVQYYKAYTDENVVQIYDGIYDLWDAHYVLSKGYPNHVHSGTGVKINEVLAAHNYTAGEVEFVEIYNTGGSTVDLTGWKLRHRYYTPYTMMGSIGPGEHKVLYKGTNQTFSMTNSYGSLSIHNENGTAEDLMQYNCNYNNDTAGYPHNYPYQIPSSASMGVSWERIPAGEDTDKDNVDFVDNPNPSPCTLLYQLPGVGGEITPLDKLLMIMPWIGIISAIAIATATTAIIYKKRRP